MRLVFRSVVAFSLACCIWLTGLVSPGIALASNKYSSKHPGAESHQARLNQRASALSSVASVTDLETVGGIAAAATAAEAVFGSTIVIATTTSASTALWGIAGLLGATTTAVVTAPVAGIVGASGLVGFGVYKGIRKLTQNHADDM